VKESSGEWTLKLRIPNWSAQASWEVNGQAGAINVQDGYAVLSRSWAAGDTVELTLAMQPVLIEAHPRVDPTRSSVAIERGPLVYCFEGVDQAPGVDVLDTQIDVSAPLGESWRSDLLGGIVTVEAAGFSADPAGWDDSLYRPVGHGAAPIRESTRLTAVPYYAWANRGENAMRVWIPRSDR
jgi:uncharacterized protein